MKIKIILKFTLTLLLITLILYGVGIEKIANNFINIDLHYFVYALFLTPLVVMIGSIKWQNIISHEAVGIQFNESLISFLGGASLGLLTPGRVGELARVVFIKKGHLANLIGIAMVDKVIDLEVTLFLGIASAYIYLGKWSSAVLVILVLLGGVFIFCPKVYTSVLKKVVTRIGLSEKFERFEKGMSTIPYQSIIICMFYRLIASGIDIIQFYLLINAFTPINLVDVIACYPIVILTNILPLTIGGIGIREGVSILTLAKFGIPPEIAASASFLLFCINTLLPGLVGSLFISKAQLSRVKA